MSFSAHAKDVHLFDSDGLKSKDYELLLQELQPGDRLFFDNDSVVFEVKQRLRRGKPGISSFQVRAMKEPLAGRELIIQVPQNLDAQDFDQLVEAYDSFRQKNVAVATSPLRRERQYIVFDFVEPKITLKSYIQKPSSHSKETQKKMEASLKTFAASLAKFEYMRNLKLSDVVYDAENDRWVLSDFSTNGHTEMKLGPVLNPSQPNPLYWILDSEFLDIYGRPKKLDPDAATALYRIKHWNDEGTKESRSLIAKAQRADLIALCRQKLAQAFGRSPKRSP
ncbi:MAG TPA: hypothetical protein VM901_04220 [Bdellovibrionota bacterium]|nr:hypothetical protein [Bdellovibrionota bacterium]